MSFAALFSTAFAQTPDVVQQAPTLKANAASPDLAQAADARSAEWSVLAAGMEQRVARLLPCDPRVRSSIEEVSRASDARFTALAAYWQDTAAQSQEQATMANKLLSDYDARLNTVQTDRTDAQNEQAFVSKQFENLRQSESKQWGLSDAVETLGPIALAKREAAARASEREKLAEQSKSGLTEIVKAAAARQSAIQKELQAFTTEGNRWREYYAARITRAQTECQLTGASATATAPRPATKRAR